MKKFFSYFLGITSALSLMIVFLFCAIEFVTFSNMGFYEEQYEKNNVYETIGISESELLNVTQYLLDYMKDEKDDLSVKAIVNNEEVYFFNEREFLHMIDVKELFLDGMKFRLILCGYILVSLIIIRWLSVDAKNVVAKSVVYGFLGGGAISLVLGIIISRDFTSAFIKFHHLLFTNDLWILNPATDRLINMVPEPFFSAIALRIGVLFIISILIVFVFSICYLIKHKRKITETKF